MDSFHSLAGAPMHSAWKESGGHLSLWWDRRRALHSANVRGGASPAPRKVAGFYHSAGVVGSRWNVWGGRFSLFQQMVDLPVYIPEERQGFWSDRHNLQPPNDRRKVVHIRHERSSHRGS